MILTSGPCGTFFTDCGVMMMNCLPMEHRAASTFVTQSVRAKFILPQENTYYHFRADFPVHAVHEHIAVTPVINFTERSGSTKGRAYNSSRQRTGAPMASHSARRRLIVEKDFSPPESVLASRPLPSFVSSGSTLQFVNTQRFQITNE